MIQVPVILRWFVEDEGDRLADPGFIDRVFDTANNIGFDVYPKFFERVFGDTSWGVNLSDGNLYSVFERLYNFYTCDHTQYAAGAIEDLSRCFDSDDLQIKHTALIVITHMTRIPESVVRYAYKTIMREETSVPIPSQGLFVTCFYTLCKALRQSNYYLTEDDAFVLLERMICEYLEDARYSKYVLNFIREIVITVDEIIRNTILISRANRFMELLSSNETTRRRLKALENVLSDCIPTQSTDGCKWSDWMWSEGTFLTCPEFKQRYLRICVDKYFISRPLKIHPEKRWVGFNYYIANKRYAIFPGLLETITHLMFYSGKPGNVFSMIPEDMMRLLRCVLYA